MAEHGVQDSSGDLDGIRFYIEKAQELSDMDVTTILKVELDEHTDFEKSWSAAKELYLSGKKEYNPHLTEEHCWALTSYTLQEPKINEKFKEACLSARRSEENWNCFRFKGLWCLILGAFNLLPNHQSPTRTFYRGIRKLQNFEEHQHYNFPHFVSASYSLHEATKFTRQSGCVLRLDDVPPEYVRDIHGFAEIEHHDEVLIWPLCTFVCKNKIERIFEFLEEKPPLQQ